MTPIQLSELQTAVRSAIEESVIYLEKLCHVEYLLKGIRFKPMEKEVEKELSKFTPEKKKTGNPLEELMHNVQKLTPEQSWQIMQKLSQSDTSAETATPTKEST